MLSRFGGTRVRIDPKNRIRSRPTLESLEERLQLSTVSPTSVTLGPGSTLYLTKTQTVPLTITLPPTSLTNKVDIALLLDDTGSFTSFASTVESIFSNLVTSLQTALPGVDIGFGVSRFEDYGGPFHSISTENQDGRPFILDQPIITASAATAAGTDLNTLMKNALAATAPGFGGDTPEADIEGLYQLATGAGFDGNGNGSNLDSGPAGALATTAVNPGNSGDIPPFSSNVGLASGSLGGIGWRPDAEHIILLATDTAPVAAFSTSPIPATVTGLGGVSVPSTAFESTAGRAGFDSTAVDGSGSGPQPAVAPLGGATVQETITALNKLGIRVIGMGPGSAPTTSTAAALDPSTFFSAIGKLTGAVDAKTGDSLVFSTSVSNSDLTTAIVNSVKTVATQPVNISLSPSSLPPGLTFSPAQTMIPKVGPGGSATFDVTLAVGSIPYTATFNADFMDEASGTVLGTVPIQISLPNDPPTVVAGQRIGVHMQPESIVVTFSDAMDPESAQNVHNYVLKGPRGGVVAFVSATYDPVAHTVTLKPKKHVDFHVYYTLTINGAGVSALTSSTGLTLDGMRTGDPGNNYVGKLRFYWLHPYAATPSTKAGSAHKSTKAAKSSPAVAATVTATHSLRKPAVKAASHKK